MPGATRPARPWGRNERETMNQLWLATGWQCVHHAAQKAATMKHVVHGPRGWWRHLPQAMGNDGEAR